MQHNRLKLDWTLSTSAERKKFVDEYISQISFSPTEDELETIANYMLFGKDEDGLNVTQRGEIQIETKNKTWSRDDVESLDALIETPTFNEATVRRPQKSAQLKVKRENFDRQAALRDCPAHMRSAFEDLFTRIDALDLQINLYEFAHGKRKDPPRASLRAQFSPEQITAFEAKVARWPQYHYLKQRHQLVELRREQFTLRDSFVEKVVRKTMPEPEGEPNSPILGADILVMPLGLRTDTRAQKAFAPYPISPSLFGKQEIEGLIHFYWEQQREFAAAPQFWFDFRDENHVYALLNLEEELIDCADASDPESTLEDFLETLRYYKEMADLNECQTEILDMKIARKRNQDIANYVNKKYGKNYTANYISTIFKQKIIPKINAAATMHAEIIVNLCFEENFKKCTSCGRTLLIGPDNFVRRARAKDGFAPRCKKCDQRDRQRRSVSK